MISPTLVSGTIESQPISDIQLETGADWKTRFRAGTGPEDEKSSTLEHRVDDKIETLSHEHPVVAPHVSHFRHVPLRTSVKFPQVPQASPS